MNALKTIKPALVLAGLALSSTAMASEEIKNPLEHGEKVHKNHCYKCHTDKVYTRENHFVRSLEALDKQVVRCKDNTNAPWFEEDTDAVVQFLNNKYYKF